MPQGQVRVVGSGYTVLEYSGKRIAWLDSFTDSGQAPFSDGGPGWQPIIPLDARRPVEIVTGRTLGAGSIQATIRELWNAPVWYQLQGLAGRRTLTDVWEALRLSPMSVTCRMVIRPPTGPARGKVYHNCVITSIPDDETVTIGALSVSRIITVVYTHSTAV